MTPDMPLETTVNLLARFREGDNEALEQLIERCLPSLRRWARGRLPYWARGGVGDTQDLVQEAVLRTLPRLSSFESRHPGALQAFLRQAIANRIIDEIRKAARHGEGGELPDDAADPGPSPLDQAIGRDQVERYEAALQALSASDREAIIARVELQQSYEEIAMALGKPSADAARMAVKRAVEKLIDEMAGLQ
jgi:RNA polymerase sigma-70 factor (ECF subfamily)